MLNDSFANEPQIARRVGAPTVASDMGASTTVHGVEVSVTPMR